MTKARDIASAAPAPAGVTSTELGYVDGVTSALQTQIDSKIGSAAAINPTIVDAKGDIIGASADNTPARLAVGADDTVLTADSAEATGLKWATPASGGSMTSIASGSLSTGTLSITSIVGTYKDLRLIVRGMTLSTAASVQIRYNNLTASQYERVAMFNNVNTGTVVGNGNQPSLIVSGNTNVTAGGDRVSLDVSFLDYTNTTSNKLVQITSSYYNSSTNEDNMLYAVGTHIFGITGLPAINRIDLFLSTGTFAAGTYILYGVN